MNFAESRVYPQLTPLHGTFQFLLRDFYSRQEEKKLFERKARQYRC